MKQRPIGALHSGLISGNGDVNQARFPGMHLKMDTPCSAKFWAFPGMS